MQQMQETWFQSLVWEDPLKKEMATHSSILAWKNLMLKGSWWVTDHGVTKSQTWLSTCQQQHGLIILLLMLHVQLYRDYKRTLQKDLKKFTYVVFVLNKLLSIFKVRSLQKFALFINVCACVLVAQSCPPLCNPMDCNCSLPSFSLHGIFQAWILESRRSSQPRYQTPVSHSAGKFFTIWATREALSFNSWSLTIWL